MVSRLIRVPLRLALGLGLCCAAGSVASAQQYWMPPKPHCPPGHVHPAPLPGHTLPPSQVPPADLPPRDLELAPEPDRVRPDRPDQAELPEQPPVADPAADLPAATPQVAPGADVAAGAQGAGTTFVGRIDSSNRFNLFDNMTAMPTNRAWVSYMRGSGFKNHLRFGQDASLALFGGAPVGTGIQPGAPAVFDLGGNLVTPATPATLTGIVDPQQLLIQQEGAVGDLVRNYRQHAIRFGTEVAFSENFSLAVQGQYIWDDKADDPRDGFTDPQVMLKYVVARSEDTVISATFGFQPDIGTRRRLVNEDGWRLYPGLLAYRQLSDTLFVQAGTQVGVPLSSRTPTTLDWALGAGYWLYRDPSLDPTWGTFDAGGGWMQAGGHCCCQTERPWLLGIVPMVEIYGKHVVDRSRFTGTFGVADQPPKGLFIQDPNTGQIRPFQDPIFVYREPREIIDLTLGTQFVLGGNHGFGTPTVGVGYSFPLTRGNVRRGEFIANLNIFF